jgi:predicted acetyltransferase
VQSAIDAVGLAGAAPPPHVLGHIGYAVVPWKQRRGYATQALRQVLPHAWAEGLPCVELTADPEDPTCATTKRAPHE